MAENCPLVIDHIESMQQTIGKVLQIKPFSDKVKALAVVFGEDNIKKIKDYDLWTRWSISWDIAEGEEEAAYCTECGQEAQNFFGWLYCPDHLDQQIEVRGKITISHLSFVTREGSPGAGVKGYLSEKIDILKLNPEIKEEDVKQYEHMLNKVNPSDSMSLYKLGTSSLGISSDKTKEELSMDLKEFEAKLEEFKDGVKKETELELRISSLTDNNKMLSEQVENAKKELESVNQKFEELKGELEALKEEKTNLEKSKEEIEEKAKTLEAELNEIKEEEARKLEEAKTKNIEKILSLKESLEGELTEEEKEDEIKLLSLLDLEKLEKRAEKLEALNEKMLKKVEEEKEEMKEKEEKDKTLSFKDANPKKEEKELNKTNRKGSISIEL